MRIKKLFLLLTALLAAALLLGAPTAQAAESSDSGSAGDTVTWTLDNKGVLTISGNGKMTSHPWLEDYAKVIKQVVIEEGVTSVYNYAFSGCSSLTSVSLPDSLTEICDFAFENCSSLESIVIPEGVTYLEWHTFGWRSNLKNVTLPVSLTGIRSSRWSWNPPSTASVTTPLPSVKIWLRSQCRKASAMWVPVPLPNAAA